MSLLFLVQLCQFQYFCRPSKWGSTPIGKNLNLNQGSENRGTDFVSHMLHIKYDGPINLTASKTTRPRETFTYNKPVHLDQF